MNNLTYILILLIGAAFFTYLGNNVDEFFYTMLPLLGLSGIIRYRDLKALKNKENKNG